MHCKQLLFAALLLCSVAALAQNKPTPPDGVRDVVKINVTSLALKNVSVQYEYLLTQKISLAIGGRAMHSTALPLKSLLISAFAKGDQDTKDIINKSRLGNVAITPEVRFYLGKGWGRGLYVAPFYRYANFSSNTLIINYSEANGPKRTVMLNGELNAHTLGAMFGAQWFFGKNFVLDWWIAGLNYGVESGSFSGVPSKPFTDSEQADVVRNINDMHVPLVSKTVEATSNSLLIKTNGGFGGVRAGLCVGVRF